MAKPKPFLVRLLQNPNLHLSLIGILIVLVMGYIFYSQRELVTREMGAILGMPVSSRDAGDPSDVSEERSATASATTDDDPLDVRPGEGRGTLNVNAASLDGDEPNEKSLNALGTGGGEAAPIKDAQKIEVTYWEIPRDTLATLISSAEKISENSYGRVYLFKDLKAVDTLQGSGQKLNVPRTVNIATAAMLSVETPPTAVEPFQYGFYVQLTKWENREAALKFDSTLILPQADTTDTSGVGPRVADTRGSGATGGARAGGVRMAVENTLNGTTALNSSQILLVVMEPSNRHPRDEYLARAGEGPWSVFTSQEFRAGLTDWVISVQLK